MGGGRKRELEMAPKPTTRPEFYASMDLSVDDTASVVSTCTTESGYSDRSKQSRKQHQRKKWKLRYRFGAAPQPFDMQVLDARKRHKRVVYERGFLTPAEVRRVMSACSHPSVRKIEDRTASLAYGHEAYRTELQLRFLAPDIYAKVMAAVEEADKTRFGGKTAKAGKCYPEFEYIDYDSGVPVDSTDPPLHKRFIEPHIDNHSIVTMVCMLSSTDEWPPGVEARVG